MTFVYTYIWMAIYFSIPFCTFFRLLAIICKNELICDTCNLYIQPNALMLFVFVYYNFVISIYVSVWYLAIFWFLVRTLIVIQRDCYNYKYVLHWWIFTVKISKCSKCFIFSTYNYVIYLYVMYVYYTQLLLCVCIQ